MSGKKSYQSLKTELDEILNWFETSEINVDDAIKKYEQAGLIIKQLEEQLSKAELQIKKLPKSS